MKLGKEERQRKRERERGMVLLTQLQKFHIRNAHSPAVIFILAQYLIKMPHYYAHIYTHNTFSLSVPNSLVSTLFLREPGAWAVGREE